ncbi:hypothetical protein ACTJJB_01655 [Chitinophaga sp. 22536]|uniref:hypothetical protein n=1 Tax=unclassified Chitinophaga TaxID=2619133 RepID=UPI003F862483
MKSILLFCLAFHLFASPMVAQLRCLTAKKYLELKGPNDRTVNKVAAICFNDNYFSFYTPEYGDRYFKMAHVRYDTIKGGFVRQTFMNEENSTMPFGEYSVEITYEKVKTVVISFTKFNSAIVVQSPTFLGSMEPIYSRVPNNLAKADSLAKAAPKPITSNSPTAEQHKEVVYTSPEVKPKFPGGIDSLIEYLRSNASIPDNHNGVLHTKFEIDSNGVAKHFDVLGQYPEGEIDKKILQTLKVMPNWKPAEYKGKRVTSELRLSVICNPSHISKISINIY